MEVFWYVELVRLISSWVWRVGKGQTHSKKLGSMFSILPVKFVGCL